MATCAHCGFDALPTFYKGSCFRCGLPYKEVGAHPKRTSGLSRRAKISGAVAFVLLLVYAATMMQTASDRGTSVQVSGGGFIISWFGLWFLVYWLMGLASALVRSSGSAAPVGVVPLDKAKAGTLPTSGISPSAFSPPVAPASPTLMERLSQLKEAHEAGLVSDEEFAAKRNDLLQRL